MIHRHKNLSKPGVGEISACVSWWKSRVTHVGFKPDFENAHWYEIRPWMLDDILAADTAIEAMAIVRGQKAESPA